MLLPRKFDLAKSLLLSLLVLVFCVPMTAQSLGDVARQSRTAPKPRAARVITNDDVETSPASRSAVSEETRKSDDTPVPGEAQKGAQQEKGKSAAKEQPSESESWNKKVSDLQTHIAQLQKDVEELRDKQARRVGVYYADAGSRLRDPAQWTKDQQLLQDETTRKEKQIEELRQQLEDTRERARKLGIRLPD